MIKLFLYYFSFNQPIQSFRCPQGIELAYLNKSDVSEVRNLIFPDSISLDIALKRLSDCEECYAAKWKNEIVSYCWFSSQAVYVTEIGKYLQVQEKEIYLYDAATRADWRGKGLYPLLLTRILEQVSRRGLNKAFIFTDSLNVPSQKGILKAGFNKFQIIYSFYVFGQYLLWHGKITEKGINKLTFLKTGNNKITC